MLSMTTTRMSPVEIERVARAAYRASYAATADRGIAEDAAGEAIAALDIPPGRWDAEHQRWYYDATDDDIALLRDGARSAGDAAMAAICTAALAGDDEARRECQSVIDDAAAQI
jgi:hypothetical protein